MKSSIQKLKRKTFINVSKAFEELTEKFKRWTGSINTNLSTDNDLKTINEKIQECVSATGGEFNARQNAVVLGNLYLCLSDIGKIKFIYELARNFDIDKEDLKQNILNYIENTDDNEISLRHKLENSLKTKMTNVLHRFISMPDGLKFIINMRADILRIEHNKSITKKVDSALKDLLSFWFDADLLNLTQITWDSSASLLEKLIKYEAVHRISSWEDLRNRLDSDRRCFAFLHSKMPYEPLIFVEVALVEEISSSIQEILDEDVPVSDLEKAKVAVFYSISSTQTGLAGINLGNFLIKRVVEKLRSEFKNLSTYVTLSPIPGFVHWLKKEDIPEKEHLPLDNPEALKNASKSVKHTLMKMCALYLTQKSGSRVCDPVEHFHLSNGATIKRINWMADTSEKGISTSLGMMVNYHYDIPKINENCARYMTKTEPTMSKDVKALLNY